MFFFIQQFTSNKTRALVKSQLVAQYIAYKSSNEFKHNKIVNHSKHFKGRMIYANFQHKL